MACALLGGWLVGGACAKREPAGAAVRVLRGSVFLRGDDGQAVRLALARVYLLSAENRAAMRLAAVDLAAASEPKLAAARAAMDEAAAAAARTEEHPRAMLELHERKLEQARAAGARNLAPWENDVAAAQSALAKVVAENLTRLEPLVSRYGVLKAEADAARWAAETSPPRGVPVAALTDAAGDFEVLVPVGVDTVLVEADAARGRVAWLLRVDGLDFSRPALLSDHNLHH